MGLYTDSDWGGCRRTRKSTTGGVIMRGPHCIKSWSVTEGPIALSSAEAEYYAMVDGVIKAMGVQTMCEEVGVNGIKGPLVLHTDSSAAKGIASRRGLGKVRHIELCELWLQNQVARGKIVVHKISGADNFSDSLTKSSTSERIMQSMKMTSHEFRVGRHSIMPMLAA